MFARSVAVVFALAMLVSFSAARAEDGKEKGIVSGVVKDAKGEIAPGVEVRLMHPMTRAERQAVKSDSGDKAAKKQAKPTPVASTTTDKDGKFELTDVPPGKYVVMARVKDVGAARQEIEVKSGKTETVDLKLKEKTEKKEEKKAE